MAVTSQQGCVLAIGIIFPRSASIIVDTVVCGRHTHTHAETHHVGNIRSLTGGQLLTDGDFSGVVQTVFKCQDSIDFLHVVSCRDNGYAFFDPMFQFQESQSRMLPYAVLLIELRPEIIVGGCAPEVGFQCGPFIQQRFAIDIVAGHQAVRFAEVDTHCGTFDDEIVAVIVTNRKRAERVAAVGHAFLYGEVCRGAFAQHELFVCDAVIGFEERLGILKAIFHIEQQFPVGRQCCNVEWQCNGHTLLRSDFQVCDNAATHRFPITQHCPA